MQKTKMLYLYAYKILATCGVFLGMMSAQVLYGQSLTEARTTDHDNPLTDPNVLLAMVFGSCFLSIYLVVFVNDYKVQQ